MLGCTGSLTFREIEGFSFREPLKVHGKETPDDGRRKPKPLKMVLQVPCGLQSTRETLGPWGTFFGAQRFLSAEPNHERNQLYEHWNKYKRTLEADAIKLDIPAGLGAKRGVLYPSAADDYVYRKLIKRGWTVTDAHKFVILHRAEAESEKASRKLRQHIDESMSAESIMPFALDWELKRSRIFSDALTTVR